MICARLYAKVEAVIEIESGRVNFFANAGFVNAYEWVMELLQVLGLILVSPDRRRSQCWYNLHLGCSCACRVSSPLQCSHSNERILHRKYFWTPSCTESARRCRLEQAERADMFWNACHDECSTTGDCSASRHEDTDCGHSPSEAVTC